MEEFTEKCVSVGIFGETVILMKERMINSTTFKGLIKQTLNFPESEGKLMNFNIMNNYMVVFTSNNFMKAYDISRKEYKQIGVSRRFEDSSGSLGDIKNCMINANGSKISILSTTKKGTVESKFYIYDLEMDSFMSFDIGNRNYLFKYFILICIGTNRVPVAIMWDKNDPRFFVAQTAYYNPGNKEKAASSEQKRPDESPLFSTDLKLNEEWKGYEINTFFCTSETGIKRQDSYRVESDFEGLFGKS